MPSRRAAVAAQSQHAAHAAADAATTERSARQRPPASFATPPNHPVSPSSRHIYPRQRSRLLDRLDVLLERLPRGAGGDRGGGRGRLLRAALGHRCHLAAAPAAKELPRRTGASGLSGRETQHLCPMSIRGGVRGVARKLSISPARACADARYRCALRCALRG